MTQSIDPVLFFLVGYFKALEAHGRHCKPVALQLVDYAIFRNEEVPRMI